MTTRRVAQSPQGPHSATLALKSGWVGFWRWWWLTLSGSEAGRPWDSTCVLGWSHVVVSGWSETKILVMTRRIIWLRIGLFFRHTWKMANVWVVTSGLDLLLRSFTWCLHVWGFPFTTLCRAHASFSSMEWSQLKCTEERTILISSLTGEKVQINWKVIVRFRILQSDCCRLSHQNKCTTLVWRKIMKNSSFSQKNPPIDSNILHSDLFWH